MIEPLTPQQQFRELTLRVIVTMPDGYAFNSAEFIYTAPIITNPEPLENDQADADAL